jgi:imidazolonepropionase-like amidohydrolase
MSLVIHGQWLVDGTGVAPVRDGCVVIEGERITACGPWGRVAVPGGARVVDLPEHTVTPGLIDAHTHISIHTLSDEMAQTTREEAEVALWGIHWLRKDLESGVTTMRTLGERRFLDLKFKRAQQAGVVQIPRLRVAGHLIVSSLTRVSVSEVVADGPDAIRRFIRETVREGADWVKYYATPWSRAVDPTMPIFSRHEVEVIFEEARSAGRPVAAHCHGGQPADWAIELGAASLEHGLYLEERHFAAMATRGVTLVPTTGIILLQPEAGATPRLMESKRRAREFLKEARRHGVRCVPGTDAVHGNIAFELRQLVQCGWRPQEALECATREGAVLLGLRDQLGTLEPGKLADVVAFVGNVTEDPEAFGRSALVVQGGVIVHEAVSRRGREPDTALTEGDTR